MAESSLRPYETPFDRSRRLWKARLFEDLAGKSAALFLHRRRNACADHRLRETA